MAASDHCELNPSIDDPPFKAVNAEFCDFLSDRDTHGRNTEGQQGFRQEK
jgi:hypothetical protein